MKQNIMLNKRFELKIGDNGFSLWDIKDGRWILDASYFKHDKQVALANSETLYFFKPIKSDIETHTKFKLVKNKQ